MPLVFLGTVTDAGPSRSDAMQGLRKNLTPAQVKKLENGEELTLQEAKRAFGPLLPKDWQTRLRSAGTVQEVDDLIDAYFGTKPVTFRVERTFRGAQLQVRQIWTGYGSGDCGYEFQVGQTYLVYAYKDPE